MSSAAAPGESTAAAAPAAAAASSSASSAPQAGSTLLKPSRPWTALVFGASGATGTQLVTRLANNPRVERVNAVVRKELPVEHWGTALLPANAEKITQTVVDFENLEASADAFRGYTAAFSCLGSTRAKAGSAAEFHRQDYGGNIAAARMTKSAGTTIYSLMSSSGADAKSFFAYMKTKGQIEETLINEIQFQHTAIFRPGLLLTERNETRIGEKIAQWIWPKLTPILPERQCAVHVQTVAEAMMQHTEHVLAAMEKENGGAEGAADAQAIAASVGAHRSVIFENDEIRAMRVAKL